MSITCSTRHPAAPRRPASGRPDGCWAATAPCPRSTGTRMLLYIAALPPAVLTVARRAARSKPLIQCVARGAARGRAAPGDRQALGPADGAGQAARAGRTASRRGLRAVWPEALLVHRLDRDTSGVIVFARSRLAQRHLGWQFERRQVAKTYVARVAGAVAGDAGRIDLPLACDWPNRPRQMVHARGKPAVTDWQVIAREPAATRLRAAAADRPQPPAPRASRRARPPDPRRSVLRRRRPPPTGCSFTPSASASATRTAAPRSRSAPRCPSDAGAGQAQSQAAPRTPELSPWRFWHEPGVELVAEDVRPHQLRHVLVEPRARSTGRRRARSRPGRGC